MTEEAQPKLTGDQIYMQRYELQEQRNAMTERLRVARQAHVEVAYLAATQEGYAEQEAAAAAEVRKLEAALSHQATVEAGALEAEEKARAEEAEERKEEFRVSAGASAAAAIAAAERLDKARAEMTSAWRELQSAWRDHGAMISHLVEGESNEMSVSLSIDRKNQMLIVLSERLARCGMDLPEANLRGELGYTDMSEVIRGLLRQVRRAGRQDSRLPGDDEEAPELPSGISGDRDTGLVIGGTSYAGEAGYYASGLTAEMVAAAAGPQRPTDAFTMPSSRRAYHDEIDVFANRYAEL